MPAPFDFPNTTANLGLPMLYSGQAQKEFFVNQGFALTDALLHRTVISSITAPPIDPAEGSAHRVVAPATGTWSGQDDTIAVMIAGAWRFIAAIDGMQIFDQSAGQILVFQGQWEATTTPAAPTGGGVIDSEARSALNALVTQLTKLGLFA